MKTGFRGAFLYLSSMSLREWQKIVIFAENIVESRMKPFLYHVASDLIARYGTDLSGVTIIFPGKRPGVFLSGYIRDLAPEARLPRYTTIERLVRRLSPLDEAERIATVCRIYRIYRQYCTDEASKFSLDEFYGWGDQLLKDFEEIDRHLVDARQILSNITDLRTIEDRGFLTDEQIEVLGRYFSTLQADGDKIDNEFRRRYRDLWQHIYEIYTTLNDELAARGQAYGAALERRACEEAAVGQQVALSPHVVCVGFYRLLPVERRLLDRVGVEHYYWDYDVAYLDKSFATPLREGLKAHPSPLDGDLYDNMRRDKRVEFVSASTDAIMTQSIHGWLEAHKTEAEHRTAVVLCDEYLLPQAIRAIPESVDKVNITKGFPLSGTLARSFIDQRLRRIEEQQPYTQVDIPAVLENLAAALDDEAARYRGEGFDATDFDQVLQSEGYIRAAEVCSHLATLARGDDDGAMSATLDISVGMLRGLLKQILRSTSIPFVGEPVEGVQIMGMLETRSLDFDHVLVIACGDDVLPGRYANRSFIPHLLREAYGLPTGRYLSQATAYNLYRLIQRASYVRLVYNDSVSGLHRGEMSRFMQQMLADRLFDVQHIRLTTTLGISEQERQIEPKPANISDYVKRISPSDINDYLSCPLIFYYKKVCGLRRPDSEEGEIPPTLFGTLFHGAAEAFYGQFRRQPEDRPTIQREHLAPYVFADKATRHARLEPFVRQSVRMEYQSRLVEYDKRIARAADDADAVARLTARREALQPVEPDVLTIRALVMLLESLIRSDINYTPFSFVAAERDCNLDLSVEVRGEQHKVRLHGVIDRLDTVVFQGREVLRLMDYKTGGDPEHLNDKKLKNIGRLLFTPARNRPRYILQTFLYALALQDENPDFLGDRPIMPMLFHVNKASMPDFVPMIAVKGSSQVSYITDFSPYAESMRRALNNLLAEILDTEVDFTPTTLSDNCLKCEFSQLCTKKKS